MAAGSSLMRESSSMSRASRLLALVAPLRLPAGIAHWTPIMYRKEPPVRVAASLSDANSKTGRKARRLRKSLPLLV